MSEVIITSLATDIRWALPQIGAIFQYASYAANNGLYPPTHKNYGRNILYQNAARRLEDKQYIIGCADKGLRRLIRDSASYYGYDMQVVKPHDPRLIQPQPSITEQYQAAIAPNGTRNSRFISQNFYRQPHEIATQIATMFAYPNPRYRLARSPANLLLADPVQWSNVSPYRVKTAKRDLRAISKAARIAAKLPKAEIMFVFIGDSADNKSAYTASAAWQSLEQQTRKRGLLAIPVAVTLAEKISLEDNAGFTTPAIEMNALSPNLTFYSLSDLTATLIAAQKYAPTAVMAREDHILPFLAATIPIKQEEGLPIIVTRDTPTEFPKLVKGGSQIGDYFTDNHQTRCRLIQPEAEGLYRIWSSLYNNDNQPFVGEAALPEPNTFVATRAVAEVTHWVKGFERDFCFQPTPNLPAQSVKAKSQFAAIEQLALL